MNKIQNILTEILIVLQSFTKERNRNKIELNYIEKIRHERKIRHK